MISNLEKTLYLKESNIFEDIPAKDLYFISLYLEENSSTKGSYLFKDGDMGDSMFFIISGSIDILKGETKLVTLNKGEYFGEMALLDDSDTKTILLLQNQVVQIVLALQMDCGTLTK